MSPFPNAIGFGPSDFLELGLAVALALLALASRPWIEPFAQRLATRTHWCMLLLFVLPVALRLLLLPNHPVPSPDLYDEFSHLLEAGTLRHFRFANPPHPLSQFFETFFVLQQPTYSSIYPPGQGAALALGWTIFGHPWAGVVLCMAAFCPLCYWMLRGWTTPSWALVGGLLAVMEFGPLNQWMNNYWGGGVPAAAGCLVFGALPRLRSGRRRDAVLFGAGLAIHALTRPFESIFLFLGAGLYFVREPMTLARAAKPVAFCLLAAGVITLVQNKQVAGSWTTLPEALSQYQYGVPASLTFQADPVPHHELTPQQQIDYKMQLSFRSGAETIRSYLLRLEYRVRFYRFFFLVPLYLALPAFLPSLREWRFAWVAMTIAIFALGVNFFPAWQFHYIAAVTCLFVLVSVTGLKRLNRHSGAARLILFLCVAHFLFWYGTHIFENADSSIAMRQYETWDSINHGNPSRRIAINRQLAQVPGKLLVFVPYSARHIFQDEWVYNEADIDAARVVWARDLGPEENEKLRKYYPDRAVWLLEPDVRPPQLSELPRTPPTPPALEPLPPPGRQPL